jgi:site-specific recombinase XerD
VPLDPRRDWQEWADVLKSAGLPRHRLHDMRHSAATIMLHKAVGLTVVQKVPGYSDIRMTKGYSHVSSPLMQEAGRMDGLLRDRKEQSK